MYFYYYYLVNVGCADCYKPFDINTQKCSNCKKCDFIFNWWIVVDDEIDYFLLAYNGKKPLQSAVLCCKECLCVGFPGQNNVLVEYKSGKLFTSKGEIEEHNYRSSFQHISKSCEKHELTVIPVLFTPNLRKIMKDYAKNTKSNCSYIGVY